VVVNLTHCRFGVIFVVFTIGWRLNNSPETGGVSPDVRQLPPLAEN